MSTHDRQKMHVVLTVNAAWNILNFRRPLVEDFLRSGWRVSVLAPRDDSVAELQTLGCEFRELKLDRKGLNPVELPALFLQYVSHFKTMQPDVVLGFTIKPNLAGALAAKPLNIPFIPNVTGLGTAFLSGGLLQSLAQALYRLSFRGLDTVFFQNGDDRDLFVKRRLVKPAQCQLLPGSGIDLEAFSQTRLPQTSPIIFLMISRLIRDKGVLEYLEAARILKDARVDARCLLLGPPGDENRTGIDPDIIRQAAADGIIEYLGASDDVRPVIAQAHCMVLPSYREGAPRTLIEGAAMGRPAVASDVSGCNSVVKDGETGLLCQVRDGADLARAMMEFCALPEADRKAMGSSARNRMENMYSIQSVIDAYRLTITKVLSAV